ncbi:MAG: amino acid adenylation domain-containing protein, partial [bacterium]|nr:amino acid adenylation domain-containing protein [bacterium]
MTEIDSKFASDLSPKQRRLLELMLKEKREREKKKKQGAPREMIPRRAPEAVPLLSFAQQRLWFIEQFQPGTAAYNIPSGVRIKGPLEAAVLDRSANEVIKRHEALRSTYALVDRQPQQVIAAELRITLPLVDLRRLPPGRREDEAQRIIDRAARTPFEMANAPPWRMLLVRIDDEDNVLLVVLHHIIADTWTTGVFFREMVGFIRYFSGQPLELPELPIQYADYAVWQRLALAEGGLLERQIGYWQEKFQDAPALLDLPIDRPRPAIPSFRGGRVSLLLPNRLTDRLKTLASECDATLFMVFMAGLQTLLFRYTHQHDILVGTPMANRNRVELENLIGLFVNTLVLRTDFSGDPPFRQLLAKLRETTLEGLSNHDVPFERVVEELTLERDTSRNPLFQVIFAFQNVPIPKLVTEGLTLERYEFGETTARLDLELDLQEMPYGFVGWLGFNADLFDPTTVSRMCADFRVLLEAVATDPDRRIGDLPLLRPGDRHQLVAEWNDTRVEYPRTASIHELFAEQAARRPEAVAVVDGRAGAPERQLSYRELNREANRLAHHLRGLGVGPEVHVAVSIERSAAMIVALLGILKAGGAYLPVDPDLPRERLAFMLEESGASILLTEEKFRGRLAGAAAQMVCPDADRDQITAHPTADPDSGARAENLAYVNFTSGSTGTPKGVSVPHRAVVRLVRGSTFTELGPDEVFLLLAPLSFDASTLELWGSLLHGARLAIYPDEKVALAELGETLRRHHVTTLWLTAGLFHLMMDERPEDLRTVRQLLAGGDVLSVPHVRRRVAEQGRGVLINGYGPTEGTTFTCCHPVRGADPIGSSVSIGRPIANTRTYIVDRALRPVPLGASGELEIGGDGLARGYLNRPDLTADRFIPDSLSREPGARSYRSGDLVRHLPDGTIEFLGRFDHQVKIRGFRLELGEIEAVLSRCPAVTDCVVVARRDPPLPKRLVAYVVAAERDPEPLRTLLRNQLPEYMMPAAFVFLDALPLGATGKVDRGALPAPESEAEPAAEFVPPQGELEQMIADRWARALNVEGVGRDDNFFEIGGNSLLLAQIHNDLRSTVAPQLTLVDMFQYPTVGALAGFLSTAEDRPTLERTLERAVARRKGRLEEESAIAIIGMALRFPGANTPDQFWENLENGVESVLPFDREQALEVGVPAQLVDDPNYVLAEGSIDHVDTFDPEFFGYGDPAELKLVDPQQRIFMENAWEALERAGYDPATYDGTIGIIGGANISSYMFSSLAHLHDPLNVMAHFLTRIGLLAGNQGDFLCTRIAYQLNLTGPAITAQTACSTTLVAVHLAAQSLLRRECDMCLAGGVQIRVPQRMGYMYQEGGFPSPDGHCRSFDARAQGNVHGNGSGVVVLKRLADAVRDGDHIHAVIKGAAVSNDGSVKVGFSAPGVEGQAKTVAEALTVAGVDPATIGYLEAAGTATELGDPIEIEALTQAYRLHTDKTGYCPIGSVKTNIGHLDVASGAAALIKTVLTLERERIPASLHFEKPNPNIDFEHSPFFVNAELRPWPRDQEPRRAAVHSYAVGGTNAHLILEEAPVPEAGSESRPWQLLVVSTRRAAALEEATANLAAHLRRFPDLPLADVAYTLQVGRRHFGHRRFVLCRDGEEAAQRLARAQGEIGEPGKDRGVAFLLPDESAFEAGMMTEIYRAEPCFRTEIDRCAELLGRDPEELVAAAPAAPVVFALEYALAQLWAEWGVRPQALVGSGVGELVAACLEGTLPLAEALARAENEPPAASAPLAEGVRGLPDSIRVLLALGPTDGLADPRLLGSPAAGEDAPAAGGDGNAALGAALGRLWLAGIAVDWEGFYRHQRRRRVTLPTYPFERMRIWAEPPADQPRESAPPSATEKLALDDWFYAPSWQRCEQPAGPPAAPAGSWLVLSDDGGVGTALARRLREDGCDVVTVGAGEAFVEIAAGEYAIDPGRG